MTSPEELDEDLFADLYEGDDTQAQPAQQVSAPAFDEPPVKPEADTASYDPGQPDVSQVDVNGDANTDIKMENGEQEPFVSNGFPGQNHASGYAEHDDNYGPIIKEDG